MIEYCITKSLPDNGQIVLCWGHRTICCSMDMDENAEWHKVVFNFIVTSYRLKKDIPKDPEESIMENFTVYECWKPLENLDEDISERIIGVTKWKSLHED